MFAGCKDCKDYVAELDGSLLKRSDLVLLRSTYCLL